MKKYFGSLSFSFLSHFSPHECDAKVFPTWEFHLTCLHFTFLVLVWWADIWCCWIDVEADRHTEANWRFDAMTTDNATDPMMLTLITPLFVIWMKSDSSLLLLHRSTWRNVISVDRRPSSLQFHDKRWTSLNENLMEKENIWREE